MDAREIDSETAYQPPAVDDPAFNLPRAKGPARPGTIRSTWHGALTGFRCVSYVSGPIAAIPIVMGLALSAFGAGSGRGLALSTWTVNGLGFFASCGLLGAMVGACVGLVGGFFRRARPGTLRATVWATANRPIRLPSWRRRNPAEATVEGRSRTGRRRWPWLLPWLIGLPLLIVLGFAFGMGAYLGRLVDRRLADAIAEADRDDPSWRLDDLMARREAVPDEENAARVVAEALEFLPENWPAVPQAPPGQPKPPPTEVQKAYEQVGDRPANVRLDDAAADTLREDLKRHEEAVRIARKVVDYRRGRHELELRPNLISTPLAETQETRHIARLLAADAAVRAHDGDLDGALDSCRAILGSGRSIGDEPFLISQLVRVAIGGVALQSMRRVLAQGEPSDAALARLQSLILDERAQPLLLHGLRGERAMMTEMIRRIRDGELPISALTEEGSTLQLGPRTVISPWGRLMFDNQLALELAWMTDAVAIARRPVVERPPLLKAWEDRMLQVKEQWHSAYSATLPLLMTPAVDAASVAHGRYQAELGAGAILLAAERQRRKSGDWPASVAAIDTEILPNPPADPFSGKAYRLERREGQIIIHSIGPNREDEHGAYNIRRWREGREDDYGTSAWDVSRRRQAD